MKTEKNILIAFILNLAFSVFEFVGGISAGSVAIISDAIHDIGDAASIGVSYFLERKSKNQPDNNYTYGYARYSVVGGTISTLIVLFGSVMIIFSAMGRIITPKEINYNGMIIFAVIGTCVNSAAAFFTRHGNSLNQRAVNLHMLEDVLGWIVVLVGAIVMRLTDLAIIDPVMSIGVAVFIIINAVKNLKEILDIFLEKAPRGIDVNTIKKHIYEIDEVLDVHHIHIWSMDGENNYATMHVVAKGDFEKIKEKIRHKLYNHKISHSTLEFETENEHCHHKHCHIELKTDLGHHHHHH